MAIETSTWDSVLKKWVDNATGSSQINGRGVRRLAVTTTFGSRNATTGEDVSNQVANAADKVTTT